LFTLGVEYLNDGRYRSAEAAFSRVLRSDPQDGEAYSQRSLARMSLEKYEEALADSQRALELSSDDVDALRTRGAAYVALGQYERAIDALNRVPADARDAETLYLRGLAWMALDRPRWAVRDFSSAIRLDPYDAEAYFHRAQVHHTLGRLRKAEADLDRALQIDPHLGTG
jgi:tetratricopeptide (TPR) repeat protein